MAEDTTTNLHRFQFEAKVWLYSGESAWHFVTLPVEKAGFIRFITQDLKGNGKRSSAVPIHATIGKTTWKTSLFWHRESDSYILPLKAAVRKAEQICVGDNLSIAIEVSV